MRKKFLAMVAVIGVLALLVTACGKPAPKATDDKNAATNKEAVLHTAWAYDVPPKSHFNVFATGTLNFPGGMFVDLMTSPLALYQWSNDTFVPQLATEWKVDTAASTVKVSLRKGVKWSDGSDFKAQDVLTYMSIGRGKSYTIWRYVDGVKATDDYTVEYHLSNPSAIALRYILRANPQPTSVYGDWAKKYDALFAAGKTAASDEMKALNKEMDAFRPTDYVASGPFKMDTKSITEAQVTLVKRADAWNAGTVKIDKVVVFNGETAQATPLVLDKKIDYVTHAFPPATEKQFTDMGLRIIRFPYYTGPAIFFNYSANPLFSKVEFRQALAYAINRDEAGTVALGKSGIGVKEMSGMADNMNATWLPADVKAKLNPYKYDLKKAEELLNKIGIKKGADGQFADASGKKLEFELYAPSDFADWSAGAENVAQQLTKFGIKTSMRGPVWSQYTADINAGKFQMGLLPWGSSTPHPTFAYQADMLNYNAGQRTQQAANKEAPGMNFPLKQTYSGGEIDFDAAAIDVGKGMDTNAQKAIAAKLATAYNELLPNLPLFERYSNAPILDGVNLTGWPKENDPVLVNGSSDQFITLLIVNGTLKGVGK